VQPLYYTTLVCTCICSPTYPARNARAPYCHLWRVRQYIIFHVLSWTALFSKRSYPL